jgi:hypothetical protein
MTTLGSQKLKAALDELAEVSLVGRKNSLAETVTKQNKRTTFLMNVIAPMHRFLFRMMCSYRS